MFEVGGNYWRVPGPTDGWMDGWIYSTLPRFRIFFLEEPTNLRKITG